MVKGKNLFDNFPPVSTKEWMDRITADLKGADFNKKLVWKTNEGFDVMPFYRKEDLENLPHLDTLPGEFPFLRGTKKTDNNWLVRQNITVTDYPEANRKALEILMKGVDSLGFVITDPESVCEKNFNILLKDIVTDSIELNFSCNGKAKEIVNLVINKAGTNPNGIRGSFEADPIGKLMLNGSLCIPINSGFDYLALVTKEASILPGFRTVNVNASNFNNAGADLVTELAFALSMGCEYLSQLTDRGISPGLAASKMRFTFGTGSNYFGEIAKLRAARVLWSVITKGFNPENIDNCRMEIHCVTSEFNKTIYDPYVNMLRTQTEAMSAVLGGTDSLTVGPFDSAFRKSDNFSERIARNQQLILKEESYFGNVADPAGGSYYIENLTSLIAENAWKLFLKIEEQGGFLKILRNGFIHSILSESAAKRKSEVAHRKTILLGTNQYPDHTETFTTSLEKGKVILENSNNEPLEIQPIKLFRVSEEFEKLRMDVDNAEARPVVFLFSIGNLAMRKARAQFSDNFFGCAGYKILDNNGFSTVNEGVNAALQTNADIIVICSSDEEYAIFGPEIYARLNMKGIIVIAGNPACSDDLKALGINDFINVRSDVVETLRKFNILLGVTEDIQKEKNEATIQI
jgi:methylmalonyl-CoA mutase